MLKFGIIDNVFLSCRPQCRIFLQGGICDRESGITTDAAVANLWVLCTHDVYVPAECMNITGPAKAVALPKLYPGLSGNNYRSYSFLLEAAGGSKRIAVDLEKNR